jgi:hypothetical protein
LRQDLSRQTFSVTYYRKRPELIEPIAAGLVAGSAFRQLARSLRCAPTTVGAESWFVYALDPAPHRGNRQSSARRVRKLRRAPRREHHGQYVGSVQRVLNSLSPLLPRGERLDLLSDGHPHYRRAVSDHPLKRSVSHAVFPNPPTTPRTPGQRRDAAQRNEAMERFALVATWRNFVKRRTERRRCDSTPAMDLKLTDQPWEWRRVLARRLFYFRQKVPAPWAELYRREWSTPLWPQNSLHRLSRNF